MSFISKTVIMTITLACFVPVALAGERQYDWRNLSPADIARLRSDRHAYFALESKRTESAMQEYVVDGGMRLDGNQADFDMKYYGLHLDLNFTSETIEASVDYRIVSLVNGLNHVVLNLRSELIVDSAKVTGVNTSFAHVSHLLDVTLPGAFNANDEFAMTVYYHGTPYYDGAAGLDFTYELGYKICWTKATPFRSRYWWPCKDYPEDKVDSLDVYIEAPADREVITNGLQVSSTTPEPGRKLVHYKHNYPICTYNVAFCCSPYNTDVQTWTYGGYSMPLYSYAIPGNAEAFAAFKTLGPQVLTILSDFFGIYPFVNEKMANGDFGWGGAMEHQTCCMYNTSFHDEWVIAHEGAHQWWGDMITCRTFHHIWLNEGFASYSEPLYFERLFGQTTYYSYMQSMEYLGEGSIYVENLIYAEIYNNSLSYDKAAWVLHMLRGVLGDSLFFRAVRDWGSSEFRYGTATTEDFIDVVSASVGQDIGWFVNQWIYGDGCPNYEIAWECKSEAGRQGGYNLIYWIEQVQTTGTYFRMPIRATFVTTGPDLDTVLWNEQPLAFYSRHFADSVTNIAFDPQKWILRTAAVVPFRMRISSRILPDAYLNQPYSYRLEAIGGTLPYYWYFWGGDLPYGLSFNPTTATISGTPNWPSTYYFTIRVTDSGSPALADTADFVLTVREPPYTCGDADSSSDIDVSDAVYLVAYIFTGGSPPAPLLAGDADCSQNVDISDAVYLIAYIFAAGPAPCDGC